MIRKYPKIPLVFLSAIMCVVGFAKDAEHLTEEVLWSYEDAAISSNDHRASICLNGLWRFKPVSAADSVAMVPAQAGVWNYFKVPGSWPGGNPDRARPGHSQLVYSGDFSPLYNIADTANAAWYQREIRVPGSWKGRKIELSVNAVQTLGSVYLSGKHVGDIVYPGGSIDLTPAVNFDEDQFLSILVVADSRMASAGDFMGPDRIVQRSEAGKLTHRGITGDVFLKSVPRQGAITDTLVITKVADGRIAFDTGLNSLKVGRYSLKADIFDGANLIKTIHSPEFFGGNKDGARIKFSDKWANAKLWDINRPDNLYSAVLSLIDRNTGKVIDEDFPQNFGFREFVIDGRDFRLNGSKIHLRSMIFDVRNGAAYTSAAAVRAVLVRLKKDGFNHIISHAYNLAPGRLGYVDALYEEASKMGFLVSLSMPHGTQYEWSLDKPDVAEKYRRDAEYAMRRFQNLPGVVFYSMNHNTAGHKADQNPFLIGTKETPEQSLSRSPGRSLSSSDKRVLDFRRQDLIMQAIVSDIDPSRIVYHHAGSVGGIYSLNCYLNWAPAQERSDWFEIWEREGVMPLMIVELGLPHVASWSSYRGPDFIWTSSGVQGAWMNEYNSAYLGEDAYRLDSSKVSMMKRHEEVAKGNKSIPFSSLSYWGVRDTPDRDKVLAMFIKDNIRDIRGRGVSSILPWDYEKLWQLAPNQPNQKQLLDDRFSGLKAPGIVPDVYVSQDVMLADPKRDWVPSRYVGETALPLFAEIIGWIGGRPGDFTEKGHNYRQGETVEKQLIILNDSRESQVVDCEWSVPELNLHFAEKITIAAGERGAMPISFVIPGEVGVLRVTLRSKFVCAGTEYSGEDEFSIDVFPAKRAGGQVPIKIALYDPEGATAHVLNELDQSYSNVRSLDGIDKYDMLIIGRNALEGIPFDISTKLESGLKVLVMEQQAKTLERLGFRVQTYGTRRAFSGSVNFPDIYWWRGASTLIPPYLDEDPASMAYPVGERNGFSLNMPWRAGNRGTVASVLIEKPSIGDFEPLMQCMFDLQYTPLMRMNIGRGSVLFSQLDISGRTEIDPQAQELLTGIIKLLHSITNEPRREVVYRGNGQGEDMLKGLGLVYNKNEKIADNALIVLGPESDVRGVREAVQRGASALTLGLDQKNLQSLFPDEQITNEIAYPDYAAGLRAQSLFNGISNADIHWRLPLEITGFDPAGQGGRILRHARLGKGDIVAVQLAPWMLDEGEFQLRTTRKRNQYLVSRLLNNFNARVADSKAELFVPGFIARENISIQAGWKLQAVNKNEAQAVKKAADATVASAKRDVQVGRSFEQQFSDLANYDGYVLYTGAFPIDPESIQSAKKITLSIGRVDDESWVWLNRKFVGEVSRQTHKAPYVVDRQYEVDLEDLSSTNTFTLLCHDIRGDGGLLDTPSLVIIRERLYLDDMISEDDPYRYYRW
jgi:beta-galactosidase